MVKTARSIHTGQEFVTDGYWLRVAFARCSWPVRNFNRQKIHLGLKQESSSARLDAVQKRGIFDFLKKEEEKEKKRQKETQAPANVYLKCVVGFSFAARHIFYGARRRQVIFAPKFQ